MKLSETTLRLGTRGSKLALWQAHHIRDRLLALGVGSVELVIIKTTGDRIQDVALSQVGGKGLFVKEIEEALLEGSIDLAVHSMKDMPSALPEGLVIAAVPEREDPRDAWVLPSDTAFDSQAATTPSAFLEALPHGAKVGTSSLRRGLQLRHLRPDLELVPLRGNVDTRLRKLDEREGGLSAIVLACAGLRRLGLGHRISWAIAPELMVPAVGQGALLIEGRADAHEVLAVLGRLEHPETRLTTSAERAFLARLEGNCQVPLGCHATLRADARLALRGFYGAGETISIAEMLGNRDEASRLGEALAIELLSRAAMPPTAPGTTS